MLSESVYIVRSENPVPPLALSPEFDGEMFMWWDTMRSRAVPARVRELKDGSVVIEPKLSEWGPMTLVPVTIDEFRSRVVPQLAGGKELMKRFKTKEDIIRFYNGMIIE